MATAKSPAMLIYLDNFDSADPAAFAAWKQKKRCDVRATVARLQAGKRRRQEHFPGP